MCRASYFNFTEFGCQFCHCNTYGAIDNGKCDNMTGKCECRSNVIGNMCEICANGFFNITSKIGCQASEFFKLFLLLSRGLHTFGFTNIFARNVNAMKKVLKIPSAIFTLGSASVSLESLD